MKNEKEIKLKELGLRELELNNDKEVKLKELSLSQASSVSDLGPTAHSSDSTSSINTYLRSVPKFNISVDGCNLLDYLKNFELLSEKLKWPAHLHTVLLSTVLHGKALSVFNTLPTESQSDYSIVKAAILKAFELTSEAYRQRFRKTRKQSDKTYIEFLYTKEKLLQQWLRSEKVDNFDLLKSLMLREELMNCLPEDIRVHVMDQNAKEERIVAELADTYTLVHKKNTFTASSHQMSTPVLHTVQTQKPQQQRGQPYSQRGKPQSSRRVEYDQKPDSTRRSTQDSSYFT